MLNDDMTMFPAFPAVFVIAPCYALLAEKGLCDAPWGAEHFRVAREYDKAGRPADIEAFIRARANVV